MTTHSGGEPGIEARNVVCDLDGVVYLGDTPVPGAGDALRTLGSRGVRIVFATNNSTTTPEDLADRIDALTGYRSIPSDIVTSSVAAGDLMHGRFTSALVVGEEGIHAALAASGISITEMPDEADAVVVGLDRSITYDRLRLAVQAVHSGATLVATNTDPTFPTPDGLLPGGGALVAAIERATGSKAVVAGKPHEPMISAIARRLADGPTVVVGDRPDTDMALAAAAGWRAVLVLTGVTGEGVEAGTEPRPDRIVRSLAELPGLLRTR